MFTVIMNICFQSSSAEKPPPDGRASKESVSSSSSRDRDTSHQKEQPRQSVSNPPSGNRELRRRGSYTIVPAPSSAPGGDKPILNPAVPLPPVNQRETTSSDDSGKSRKSRERSRKNQGQGQGQVEGQKDAETVPGGKNMTVLPPLALGPGRNSFCQCCEKVGPYVRFQILLPGPARECRPLSLR